MARPTAATRHVDAAMSNISIAYKNTNYIADMVAPVVRVQKQTDKYFTFDKSSWFRNEISPRAPGTRANRVDFALTTASYIALPYALGKTVTDEERENADAALQPDIEATEFVTDQLLLGLEIRVANKISASSNWASSSNLTSGTKWSSDSSTPTANIITCITKVRQTIGRRPNVAVMGAQVFETLMNHPEFLDRLKYARPGAILTPNDIAGWFGFEKMLIGEGITNSANEGAADSFADIWPDFFWCGWVSPNATLRTPSAMYVFEWQNRMVERFREDQEHQDVITAQHYTAEQITASDAGACYSDLL